MEEDLEKKEENDDMERTDHFRQFMFGTNYSSTNNQKDIRKETKVYKQEEIIKKRNRGDAWILGMNGNNPLKEEYHDDQQQEGDQRLDAVAKFFDQIDLELLMKSVDSFMTSANELKPIVKKMAPFIKKWMD